jgi:hypothetical protein
MRNRLWLFPLLLIMFRIPAAAGTASAKTADDLMDDCRYADADVQKLDSGQMTAVVGCINYITGVLDGYAVGVATGSSGRTMVCNVPDTVTARQLALIVLKYGRDNPAELHWLASALTMTALNKSFPCKSESQP